MAASLREHSDGARLPIRKTLGASRHRPRFLKGHHWRRQARALRHQGGRQHGLTCCRRRRRCRGCPRRLPHRASHLGHGATPQAATYLPRTANVPALTRRAAVRARPSGPRWHPHAPLRARPHDAASSPTSPSPPPSASHSHRAPRVPRPWPPHRRVLRPCRSPSEGQRAARRSHPGAEARGSASGPN